MRCMLMPQSWNITTFGRAGWPLVGQRGNREPLETHKRSGPLGRRNSPAWQGPLCPSAIPPTLPTRMGSDSPEIMLQASAPANAGIHSSTPAMRTSTSSPGYKFQDGTVRVPISPSSAGQIKTSSKSLPSATSKAKDLSIKSSFRMPCMCVTAPWHSHTCSG